MLEKAEEAEPGRRHPSLIFHERAGGRFRCDDRRARDRQIAADDVGFGHGVVEGVVTVGASDDGVE